MESNIKPSLIKTFNEMYNALIKVGFKPKDIILLIQNRTKPKLPLATIRIMLKALIQFEKDFIRFKSIITTED